SPPLFFFSPHPPTTHIFTLSLHDALPIFPTIAQRIADQRELDLFRQASTEPESLKRLEALREWESAYPNSEFRRVRRLYFAVARSEEHTSELQSPYDLVCRLLLEKKKNN